MRGIVKNHSLTMRVALLFAALSFVVLGLVGVMLYQGLEAQLTLRDDTALVARVYQIRALLQDSNTMKLINERPKLFENMLANREALLVIHFAGQAPLIEVNPGNMPIPDIQPISQDAELSERAVQRSIDAKGVPFIALAATTQVDDSHHDLVIIVGRAMTERTHLLESYRNRILVQISIAALLFALVGYWLVRRGLLPLRRLAEQTETITFSNLTARIDATSAPRELAPVIDSFNAMLERLATGFTQLSQVSADMAHDLRTPINNLLGQTEVALSQPRSIDHYELLLASNLEELQRLSKMTDNMLFLARSGNTDTAIERKMLDLTDELQRMTDYFEGLAEDRHLRIETKGDGVVYADPMLLRRALANLMANAIKYAYEETTISLQSEKAADGVILFVENRGPTIAEHDLPRIFDRFYRADASRRGSADSSGLGLSIVRTIMTLHQGHWKVTSVVGLTRFSLFFPATRGK